MPFTIDFLDDGRVIEWDATGDGAVATEIVTRRPGFRHDEEPVLAVDVDPTPASEPSTLRLSIPVTEMGADTYAELSFNGDFCCRCRARTRPIHRPDNFGI